MKKAGGVKNLLSFCYYNIEKRPVAWFHKRRLRQRSFGISCNIVALLTAFVAYMLRGIIGSFYFHIPFFWTVP
ncbi:hypothetical protein HMPREF1082_03322 [[Clostridium] clostridioforme 90A7]|nr:hypothetical protein HMPREF1082_03322 [[Clostridium] clostridioforme 90A7]